jgi:hypothetical protein
MSPWVVKHPSIQDSFFLKVEAPTNLDDAVIKMSCHQHAVNDFDLQLNINDLEIGMLTDHTSSKEVFPYNEARIEELEAKKLKLLLSKRFHQNATNAYWYYVERQGK